MTLLAFFSTDSKSAPKFCVLWYPYRICDIKKKNQFSIFWKLWCKRRTEWLKKRKNVNFRVSEFLFCQNDTIIVPYCKVQYALWIIHTEATSGKANVRYTITEVKEERGQDDGCSLEKELQRKKGGSYYVHGELLYVIKIPILSLFVPWLCQLMKAERQGCSWWWCVQLCMCDSGASVLCDRTAQIRNFCPDRIRIRSDLFVCIISLENLKIS